MKTFFFLLALLSLSLAASSAFAQCNDVQGQGGYGQCHEDQIKKLDLCQDYMMERCREIGSWRWVPNCEDLRRQCCEQMSETSQQYRCKAICKGFQRELSDLLRQSAELGPPFTPSLQEQVPKLMQRANSLPSMCNMNPGYCNISPIGDCY
ncbi:hordoindoline-A [Brachypodium distachyon]|uniref:Bifunctional inhibitor/plant lipid transfer protein/seed storage helical domain-containing protein n=1 Tax=Brachypodium distachyon TaxID=15368 RepID=I1IG09_BRADI|nr:hordoindoline-A [Brachypodium distachyon]KQJ85586.1 hypothetical protein BRADI_4g00420v3 [Brachypodium distachyon]|eukprot:XP_003577841.1 hordoindoline-A [Brachypodium distachyon]